MIKFLKLSVRYVKQLLVLFKVSSFEFTQMLRYSLSPINESRDSHLAFIMLAMHSLEKGLSFEQKKKGWGKNKALLLASKIDSYFKSGFENNIRIQLAICVLQKYLDDICASKEISVSAKISMIIAKYKKEGFCSVEGGVKAIKKPAFLLSEEEIVDFFKDRASVRYFSEENVTDEQISKALNFAALTPSACNRQASKVYVFKNREKIKQIISVQYGDQGWCMNCNVLFVVTTNRSFFNVEYESKEPYIDGGIYATYLVLGLHLQKIASCYKMFIRKPKLEKVFKNICSIPQQEIPIILILAGHYPETSNRCSPLSQRLSQSMLNE